MPGSRVVSFSQEYGGAYSCGGFMKCVGTGITGATGAWHPVIDPSGHMPRLQHGGDIQFIRIMIPVPKGSDAGPPAGFNLVAEYEGTGGNEVWAMRTGQTGPTAGLYWPRFQARIPAAETVYCCYVEYGRVHSVPR